MTADSPFTSTWCLRNKALFQEQDREKAPEAAASDAFFVASKALVTLIFASCGNAAADMALRFVQIQNLLYLKEKRTVKGG